ncbi:MAG: proton-conducting transporter membrane subunit [bacterium]
MVTGLQNPLSIFIIALGTAFLLSIFYKAGKQIASIIFLVALGSMTVVAGVGLFNQVNGQQALEIYTAGFMPPFSINLRFGLFEAFASFSVNLLGIMGGLYLLDRLQRNVQSLVLFLIAVMGVNGLIMTRDLFNLFVFIEIASIASFALVAMEQDAKALTAGLKYLIAAGIASSFFLLGTIFLYHLTGTLNIDGLIETKSSITGVVGVTALTFLFGALMVEMKPFPANGWGLDVYQASPGGVAAFISVGISTGSLFALYKVLPLLTPHLSLIIALAGITFFFSNLMGLNQTNVKRMLGYSSIAQMGLLLLSLALLTRLDAEEKIPWIVGGLFINHFLAKAGLFWVAGIIKKETTHEWKGLAQSRVLYVIFGLFVIALVGFPPFPGFWAKWELLMALGAEGSHFWIAVILAGSLLEAVYILRWLGLTFQKGDSNWTLPSGRFIPVAGFGILLLACSWFMAIHSGAGSFWMLAPIYAATLLYALDFLPGRLKSLLAMAMVAGFAYVTFPLFSGVTLWFAVMFLAGSLVVMVAGFYRDDKRPGYYPMLTMMVLSLGTLLLAETMLEFFLAWELMTLSSYILVRIGKKGQQPALMYVLFSLGGAFSILGGFALAYGATGSSALSAIAGAGTLTPVVYVLLAIGFLVKSGALGVHIWVRGAYAESDDDFSAILSPVVSKAGIFGLLMVGIHLGRQSSGILSFPELISWLGVLTAMIASIMAAMQEDMKKLLAYSSMGQVGYIVASVATMSHLGWVAALYQSLNHFMFKALIFLAIAGVIHRTGTRYMYQLGGLIKRMPLSYISVLVGIIAMSGVPPLSGFGGKWMFYTALFEQKMYFQLVVAFAASGVAFLYMWRLIHTIFLGQLKLEHREIREAPVWVLIPQVILMIGIMVFSTFPKWFIVPFSDAVAPYFPSTVSWTDNLMSSSLGYWNGFAVMIGTGIIFMIPLLILLFTRLRQRVQTVKQLNIVFASERPDKPEWIHIGHNVFAHYQKAMGDLVVPRATRFWDGFAEWVHSTGAALTGIYTGNGQTYAFHIVLYVIVLYFIMGV